MPLKAHEVKQVARELVKLGKIKVYAKNGGDFHISTDFKGKQMAGVAIAAHIETHLQALAKAYLEGESMVPESEQEEA